MKMSKIILSIVLLVGLSGCQLAKNTTVSGEDQLMGIFITTESLGTDEFTITGNNEIKEKNDKIYASYASETYENEDGSLSELGDYVFENLEGIPFYFTKIENENGIHINSSDTKGFISNVQMATRVTDDMNELDNEGTIYFSTRVSDLIFFANPVYQEPDGNVYVVATNGLAIFGDIEGQKASQKLESTISTTDNDKTITEKTIITINYESKLDSSKTRVIEMNKENEVIFITEILKDATPEKLKLSENTEYIIIETVSMDSTNKEIIEREILPITADSFTIYECQDNGIFVSKTILID